jgi:hypothetical protein
MIDTGELRWDTSERGLLTDTAAILDGPKRRASRPRRPEFRRAELLLRQNLHPLSTSTSIRTSFSQHRDLKPAAASKCEDPDC